MATIGQNTLARDVATKAIFIDISKKIDSAISFNQGDCLIYDAATDKVRVATVETEAATFLGIAPVTVVSGNYPQIYNTQVNNSVAVPAIPGPQYGSVYRLILKAGDAITAGDQVFLAPASDAQTVSVTGTKAIGIYQGQALTAPAGGTVIEVLVGARYSNDTLKF